MKEKRKVGRPPKPESERHGPNRNFGCVHDDEWNELKRAAAREEKTFTAWAKGILLTVARTRKKTKKQ